MHVIINETTETVYRCDTGPTRMAEGPPSDVYILLLRLLQSSGGIGMAGGCLSPCPSPDLRPDPRLPCVFLMCLSIWSLVVISISFLVSLHLKRQVPVQRSIQSSGPFKATLYFPDRLSIARYSFIQLSLLNVSFHLVFGSHLRLLPGISAFNTLLCVCSSSLLITSSSLQSFLCYSLRQSDIAVKYCKHTCSSKEEVTPCMRGI